MDQEEQRQLKDKALLLLRRERELFALRMKNEQVASWLRLAQSLPQLIDRTLGLDANYTRITRALIAGLRVQRVNLFQLGPAALGPISQTGTEQPLGDETAALLARSRSGLCNDPGDAASRGLAQAVGLHRFIWSRIQIADGPPLLLVAGFDREKAVFQGQFDESNVAQIGNFGQHLESLLSNMLLVNELERDKKRLQEFNETLERRVEERTSELADALAALREKDARLQDDLHQARSFQQGILPVLRDFDGVEIGAVYRPVDLVGGDIYDVCEIKPRLYRMFVADATGHGVQASLRTIVLKAEYDRLKEACATPDVLLRELNQHLTAMYAQGEMLSTACCVDVDLRDAAAPAVRCSIAAHPPPLRILRNGQVEELGDLGPFLAMHQKRKFPLHTFPLERGDMLFVYSDGVSEQPGPDGASFGFQRAALDAAASGAPPQSALQEVLRQLDGFRGAVPIADDITLLAARIG